MKQLITIFSLIVTIFVSGCNTIDWDGFYLLTDDCHPQAGSWNCTARRELDSGRITPQDVVEYACDSGRYDLDECPPPTPIPIISPVSSAKFDSIVPFSDEWWDWYDEQMDGISK